MINCKDIEGFEKCYKVYENGVVESYNRIDSLGRLHNGKVLSPFVDKDGYLCIKLRKNGKQTPPIKISRLVWKTFVGPIPEGYDIHHINHNRQDNRLENLCLIESSRHKAMHISERNVEEKSKPVLQYNKDGQFIAEYPSISEASRQTGISIPAIHNCLTGRSKTSGKCLWEYK